MSDDRTGVNKWNFDPENALADQWWEEQYDTGKTDKNNQPIKGWRRQDKRDAPTLTKDGLIEMWWKVLVQKQYDGKRSVSTIAKHYNDTIRNIKTQRAYINSEYKRIKDDNEAVLLPELKDFTDRETERIDRATKQMSVADMYDALPPELKKLAEAYKRS